MKVACFCLKQGERSREPSRTRSTQNPRSTSLLSTITGESGEGWSQKVLVTCYFRISVYGMPKMLPLPHPSPPPPPPSDYQPFYENHPTVLPSNRSFRKLGCIQFILQKLAKRKKHSQHVYSNIPRTFHL